MEWIQPMEPILIPDVADGEEFVHEIKWDGIRGLVYVQNGGLQVFTKRRNERTAFYPELSEAAGLLKARQAVLDGEIVIFDEAAKPSFYLSLVRERVRDQRKVSYYSGRFPAKYIIFDILFLNGRDLTSRPLSERKKILQDSMGRSESITLTDSFSDGRNLYRLMKDKGWEGIVSKRRDSSYVSGKAHDSWFKTKLSRKMLTVVGGIQWKTGLPNSLLLGVNKPEGLVFVGKASLGLTQEEIYLLKGRSPGLAAGECPFRRESLAALRGDFTWLKPLLTCWVHFMEFTNDGQMRHPKILGFSTAGPGEAVGKEYME